MAKAIAKKKITQEAYETALTDYVHNDNLACMLAAERDKELEPINNKYNPQFEKLKGEMDEQFAVIQQYAEDNRDELFTEGKSIEAHGALLGFRDGKDKVMILDGYKEKDIVTVMLKRKALAPYVRTSYAMDKVSIIKDKPKGTEKIGFKVDKEESFFLEPIKTLLPE